MEVKTYLKSALTISLLLVVLPFTATAHAKIIYVDDDAVGANDGSSWADAFNYLQDALAAAWSGDEIRVAQGTYTPDSNSADPNGSGDREATFRLINGVTLKGGYAGAGEPDPNARNIELYKTILSGDLTGNDVEVTNPRDLLYGPTRAENSYHVVTGNETTDEATILDGFIITGGNANQDPRSPHYFWNRGGGMSCMGSSPTVTNCTFLANTACWGAGMCIGIGSPTLTNCIFRANAADHHAGALEVDETYVLITNCIFIGNFAAWNGGAVWNFDAAPPYINCVFSGNVAIGDGGAIWNVDSSGYRFINCTFTNNTAGRQAGAIDSDCWPMMTNCIFWGNRDNSGMGESAHVHAYYGPPTFNYCCVQRWTGALDGFGNTGEDPLFVEADGADNFPGTEDDNLRLLAGSACLDSGDNSSLPPSVHTDLDGNPRIINGTVDMGAYEGLNQGFLLSTSSVTIPEGETAQFSVALATDPAGTVEVTVAHESGDTDITVISPGLLIFESSNYSEPRVVTVAAAQDADYLHDKALIFISAVGFPTAGVTATELDDEAPKILYADSDAPGTGDGTSWTDAFTRLQDALRVAKAVPEVQELWVAQGIYKPDQGDGFRPGDQRATFKILNGLAIKGGYAGFGEPNPDARDINLYETILSGDLNGDDIEVTDPCDLFAEPSRAENTWHVVTSEQYTDETAVLDGFTITCGNANEPDLDNSRGGGMYNGYKSNPTLKNCTFVANSSGYDGGGMHNYNSSPILTNCTFSRNSTAGYRTASGGGMFNSYSSPILSGCIFSGNSAIYWGGGMYNEDSNPTLVNCIFSENSAYCEWGGGGGMATCYGSSSTITNCLFSGNSAQYAGGAICNWSAKSTLTNCIFSSNSAGYAGSAIYVHSSSSRYSQTLENCTFYENLTSNGNALACDSYRQRHPGNVQITNSILWGAPNQIWNNDNSTITVTYSDVYDGWPGEGNINSDPLFVNPGHWDANGMWIDGDYHLFPDSPCIDAGDPNHLFDPNEKDLDGRPRVISGRIDMGAYEYSPPISAAVRIVPRTINLQSKGKWIAAYIRLPEDYNVTDIEPNSVLLDDESEPQWFLCDEEEQVVMVRFSRSEVQSIPDTGDVELTITGQLTDGTVFEATDTIKVIDKSAKN